MAPYMFPLNLKPSTRAYNPGVYPQTDFVAQNGATTVLRYGNRRVNSKLQLTFANISDADAASILANYEIVNANWDYVFINSINGAAGAGDALALYIAERNGSGLKWRYAGPPEVQSVYPGISNVSCEFVGVLDGN